MTSKADEPVWTAKDIVDHASKWSLAGDAALLRHLEAFSEELFSKATRTNDDLNGLLDDLDAATIRLDLVKNEFLGLQNTQFIESRVYEDDETVEKPVIEKDEVKDVDKEAVQNAIRDSVLEGLKVLDQFYERVSLPGSDTEDEDADSFVLRPKDPYLGRPLPYIIGTEEWNSTWHVGLDMSDSEEEEVVEERYSDDAGSDVDLPVTDRRDRTADGLESGGDDVPVASSTMNDSRVSTDDDDDDKPNSIPSKAPLSNASFAEQLAAKLGGVRSEREDEVEEEVNTRPIQPTVTRPHQIGGLLSNEPPPLDDLDDGLFNNTGLFSNGDGLFDDDASESFWGRISVKQTQPDKKQGQFSAQGGGAGVTKKNDRDIFDDDEEDDDDAIFSTASAPKLPKSNSILKGYSNTISFVDDEPPELFVETNDKKPKAGSSANTESSTPSPQSDDKLLINAKQERKAPSLFDDFVDPFKNDLFAGSGSGLFSAPPPKIPGLFDDEDMFAPKAAPPRLLDDDGLDEPQKARGLFDDDDDGELFANQPASDDVLKRSTLFDNEPPPLDGAESDKDSLFGDSSKKPPSYGVKSESLFDKDSLFDEGTKSAKLDSLFDDDNNVAGSLFDVPPPLEVEKSKREGNSLFDDDDDDENVPPPLEVEKSRSNSLFDEDSSDDDMFGGGKQKPPPLPKPAVRTKPVPAKRDVQAEDKSRPKSGSSPGKLKHNLNINVNALLPGAALPKRRDSASSLNKSQSLEETTSATAERSAGNLTHSRSQEDNRETAAVDDDDGDGHIRPLFSITKNRARVQTKRRPSTRRGRKEHLQKAQDETLNNNLPSQDVDAQLDNRVEQDPNLNGNYLANPEVTSHVIGRNAASSGVPSKVHTEDLVSNVSRVRTEDIFKDIESNVSKSQTEDIFKDVDSNVDISKNVDYKGSGAQAEDIFRGVDSNVSKVRAEDIFKDVGSERSGVQAEDILKDVDSNVSKARAQDIFKDVDYKRSEVQVEDIFKDAESNVGKVRAEDIFKDVDSERNEVQAEDIFKNADSNVRKIHAEDIFKDVDSKGSGIQAEDIFKDADSKPKVEGESGQGKTFKKDLDDGLYSGSEDLFERPPTKDIFDHFKDDLFGDVQVKKEVVDTDDLFGPQRSDNLFATAKSENLFGRVPKSESPIDIFEEAASALETKPPPIFTKNSDKVTADRLFEGIFGDVKAATVKSKTGGGLFDDDGGDLFGHKKGGYFAEKKKNAAAQRKKDSLFDDVDEDDDIFGSGAKFAPSKVLPVAERKSKARSLVKRAEETAVDYDPLDALGSKE